MLFSINTQAFAASENVTSTAERPGIEFITKDITDESALLQYYLNKDGKKLLVSEEAQVIKGTITTQYSSVEVNNDDQIVPNTKKIEHFKARVSDSDKLRNMTTESDTLTRSALNWKSYSATYSLRGAQMTVLSIATLLAAASSMGLSVAISTAASMLNIWVGWGLSSVPKSVYFSGQRCVSKASGKIYYRYKGNIYKDKNKKAVLARNISWSRRWGH